jgi:hypothetical protein
VRESDHCTYFCVIGWSPGGYSGIQQINGERRVAIFSMWNDDNGNGSVGEVAHGEGVEVSSFGGEGTGLKSMKDVAWREGEEAIFTVKGVIMETEDGLETWHCSCWFQLGDGGKQLMATYMRKSSQRPLNRNGFYSFVEDWDRSCGAKGHCRRRKGEFFGASVNGRPLTNALFTKVEDGADEFASAKACGYTDGTDKFVLCTGGPDDEGIREVKHYTQLRLCD